MGDAELRAALLASHRRTRRARWLRKAQAFDRAVGRAWRWVHSSGWPVVYAVALAVVAVFWVVADG